MKDGKLLMPIALWLMSGLIMTAGFWSSFHGPVAWRHSLYVIGYFAIVSHIMVVPGILLFLAYAYLMIREKKMDRLYLFGAVTGLLVATQFLAVGVTLAMLIS